jgi:hypothetical protein
MTQEHVWPEWLKDIASGPVGDYKVGNTGDPGGWRQWRGASFSHTAGILCEACNHRLGALEGQVKPIVLRLLDGRATSVEAAEQSVLAQWLYKTGLMVSASMGEESARVPRWHYSDLATSLDLPPSSVVWVGRLDRRVQEAALWVQRFHWWDRELAEPTQAEGYIFFLGVGELLAIVGVLDVRQSPGSRDIGDAFKLGDLGVGRLLRIWPASTVYGHRWPPPESIRGEDLANMASAFVAWAERNQRGAPPGAS